MSEQQTPGQTGGPKKPMKFWQRPSFCATLVLLGAALLVLSSLVGAFSAVPGALLMAVGVIMAAIHRQKRARELEELMRQEELKAQEAKRREAAQTDGGAKS